MISASASVSTVRSPRRSASSWRRAERATTSSSHRRRSFRIRFMRVSKSSLARRVAVLVVASGAVAIFATSSSMQSPRFYPHDPISREPESQDASKTAPYDQSQMYELFFNLFINSGRVASGLRAMNINTIDEVPDSSWFTNRIGTTPITPAEITRGANVGAPPDPSKWVLTREKTSGAHPGFTANDAKGQTWFLEFDPVNYPE